jgi:hypothetical protein
VLENVRTKYFDTAGAVLLSKGDFSAARSGWRTHFDKLHAEIENRVWRMCFEPEKNVPPLPFLCNILRIADGEIERTLDFLGFLLARDVLGKRHTPALERNICSISVPT